MSDDQPRPFANGGEHEFTLTIEEAADRYAVHVQSWSWSSDSAWSRGLLLRAGTRPDINQITPDCVRPRRRVKKRLSILVETRIQHDKVPEPRIAVVHVVQNLFFALGGVCARITVTAHF